MPYIKAIGFAVAVFAVAVVATIIAIVLSILAFPLWWRGVFDSLWKAMR